LGHLQPRGSYVQLNLKKIKQSSYFPSSGDVVGLSSTAFLYAPSSCQSGTKCAIHVAFHGCNQNIDSIGNVYAVNAGYNFFFFFFFFFFNLIYRIFGMG
jgi:poly(3-hydroxybutyrate) depolymerase